MKLNVLFVIVLLLLFGLSGCGDNPYIQRGKDWLDIGNTSKAREEFMKAINDSPKNISARYHMAYSYYVDGNYFDAISWSSETLSISQNHNKTINLLNKIHEDAKSLLSSQNVNQQALGLEIIVNFLSKEDIGYLKKVIGSINDNNALKAEKLLSRINRNEAREGLVSLLSTPNQKVRERVAERLWLIEKNPDATNILRDKYINILIDSGNDKSSINTAGEWLVKLAFDRSLHAEVEEKLGIHDPTHLVVENLGEKVSQEEFTDTSIRWSRVFFRNSKENVVQQVWRQMALFSHAEKMGIFITGLELKLEIRNYFPVDFDFADKEGYSHILTSAFHLTEPQFEQTIKEYLLARKLQYFLRKSVKITEDEAYQKFVKENEKVDLEIFEKEKESIMAQYLIEKQLAFLAQWESWVQEKIVLDDSVVNTIGKGESVTSE